MERGERAAGVGPHFGRGSRLFVPWLAVSALWVWMMWAFPGDEVVPFHLIWIAFALAYGIEAWPVRRTVVSLVVLAVTAGAILVHRARTGVVAWEELGEIPLMLFFSILVMWQVLRRQDAFATVTRLARREVTLAERRERLARLTSHEMRTPLTIASGYVDLLLTQEDRDDRRADLLVVRDELGRLLRAGERLLRMIQMEDLLQRVPVDVQALLQETTQRWSAVAARTWVVEAHDGTFEGSPERLRACLDTLIENAIRYTAPGSTVRLFSHRHRGYLWLGVADSGPGFADGQALRINRRPTFAAEIPGPDEEWDPRSQTGLGLGIVQEIVEARHGRVLAGRAREGGALVTMVLPLLTTSTQRAPG